MEAVGLSPRHHRSRVCRYDLSIQPFPQDHILGMWLRNGLVPSLLFTFFIYGLTCALASMCLGFGGDVDELTYF